MVSSLKVAPASVVVELAEGVSYSGAELVLCHSTVQYSSTVLGLIT